MFFRGEIETLFKSLNTLAFAALLTAAMAFGAPVAAQDAASVSAWNGTCELSVAGDFSARDSLEPSRLPRSEWDDTTRYDRWGPGAITFPPAPVPAECDETRWQEQRILAVVEKLVDMELNYCYHHVPLWEPPPEARLPRNCNARGSGWRGVDCSNFTSWVYNYGLGIRFTSGIRAQADGRKAPGVVLPVAAESIGENADSLRPGDLIFIDNKRRTGISHVAIWTGKRVGVDFPKSQIVEGWRKFAKEGDYVIADSTGVGPRYRPFRGWYKKRFSHARRVIGYEPPGP